MGINIQWLQTGGVPLTNDLLNTLQKAYEIYNSMASLAGNLTIITGCETVGNTVNSGVVAIDGEFYYFEGGYGDTVFIAVEEKSEIFEDTLDKVLVVGKTVRFGNAATVYQWSDFVKLEPLKDIQKLAKAAATQDQVTDLAAQIQELKILTAPILTKKIRWFFLGTIAEIPAGWEIDINMQGFVPIGVDPNDVNFNEAGKKFGTKTHQLTEGEMPAHSHRMPNQITIQSAGKANSDAYHRVNGGYTERDTYSKGGNQPHNNMQPSIAGYWIKPI
ncbi:phage baseplate protein [Chryseobacterium sp.]|uniref:phage baseplate protein n=1 Tax=Chryseobacterium sp. TaxID=1871047 RepID=UPI0028A10C24|nr:hypothetical protein [Chryseobacterium sp.]